MKRVHIGMALAVCVFEVAAVLLAQDSGQSLGDVARKEREREVQSSKSGTQPKKVWTNEDFRPTSQGRVQGAAHVRFVDLQIGADRPGGDYFVFVPAEPKADLCRDECAKDPNCKAFSYIKSNQPGSRPVCHLKSLVTPAVADGISISGVKAEKRGGPPGAKSTHQPPAADGAESTAVPGLGIFEQLSPDEARALSNLQTIGVAEAFCRRAADVYIPLEDLKTLGCRGRASHAPLRDALMKDPEYDYTVGISGDEVGIRATPRHRGRAGFFSDGTSVFYNPSGPASEGDTLIGTHEALKKSPEFRQVTFKAMTAVLNTKK